MKDKNLQAKVEKVLKKIKKALQVHGGSVRLIEIKDNNVYVELQGACKGCPMADITLKQGIETQLKEEIPEIKNVYNVDQEKNR